MQKDAPVPPNRVAANELFKQNKLPEAVAAYSNCIKECDPSNTVELAVLHNNLGLALKKQQQIPAALTAFGESIKLDPTYVKPLYQRFSLNLLNREFEKAHEDGLVILNIEPDFMGGSLKNEIMKNLEKAIRKKNTRKIPVTILTGFLGSGKTTLLNRILKENHGKKIAVIENEFGAQGIDQALVEDATHGEEQLIEVMNGCVCCTVRKDLVDTLKAMKEKYVYTGKIDYIIIETSGMADPAPVLQTFLLDDSLQEWTSLDAVITVADTSAIAMRLTEERAKGCENEAVEQVCFADKVLLNKIDVCNRKQIDEATLKVREYNTQCTISEV